MPDFPLVTSVPRTSGRSYTVQLLAAGGDTASTSLDGIDTAVSGLELATLRQRIGEASNAVVIQTTQSELVTVPKSRVNPLDETYSAASDKLILNFQDDDLNLRTIAIPAPDEILFASDGITAVTPSASAAAATGEKILNDLIVAVRVVVNGGALGTGTFQYLNGYRSQRSRKLPKPRTSRRPAEPASGSLPPPEPGV